MDTQKQTFSRLLHISPACGKITETREKALCPICRRGVVAYLLPEDAEAQGCNVRFSLSAGPSYYLT